MKKNTITELINYYYDIYDTVNGDEEFIIYCIFVIMTRNRRYINKQVIRRDLSDLNLKKYKYVLEELSSYPYFKFNELKKDYDSDLKPIINKLLAFDKDDNLKNKDLDRIIEICNRLKEV
ncbi:MAG: hypothetical protein KAU90_09500 [Sulfurovaceae bacterium]|nr:hypothetical protein [Sulfurovaceae bacterium]